MKKTTLYSFLISCIQLSATERPALTFNPKCLMQYPATNAVPESTPHPLFLRQLGFNDKHVETILEQLDGTPKRHADVLVMICAQRAKTMTLEQTADFVAGLRNVSYEKADILLKNSNIFLYFLPKNRINLLHFAKSVDENVLIEMCRLMFKVGVEFREPDPSCEIQFALYLNLANLYHQTYGLYNSELLDLFKFIEAENATYLNDWIEKLADDYGPQNTRLAIYKVLLRTMRLDSSQPIEVTDDNVQIFKQALTAEHELFGRRSFILSSIAFNNFIVATEVFKFLRTISRTPRELTGFDQVLKYFCTLDQEYLTPFKDVVTISGVRNQLDVFLLILYCLGKERWSEFETFLRGYTNYFQYVPLDSLHRVLLNRLRDGENISAEFLENQLRYLYNAHFHGVNFNTLNQHQSLIFSRLRNHPFFQDTMQIHNYYHQCILFKGQSMTLSRAILLVINRENSLQQNSYYDRDFIKNTLKSITASDQTIESFLSSIDQISGENDLLTEVFRFLYRENNSNAPLKSWIQSLINESENAFTLTLQNERSCNQGIFERMFTSLRYSDHGSDELDTIFAQGEKLMMIQTKLQNFNGNWAQKAYEFGLRSGSSLDAVREKFNHILLDYLEIGHASDSINLNQSIKVIYEAVVDHCVDNIFPDIKGELEFYAYLDILS